MKKEVLEFHSEFCKSFSSPKRLEILCLLKERELTVTDITKKLGASKANVSQQLSLMRMIGVLRVSASPALSISRENIPDEVRSVLKRYSSERHTLPQ